MKCKLQFTEICSGNDFHFSEYLIECGILKIIALKSKTIQNDNLNVC